MKRTLRWVALGAALGALIFWLAGGWGPRIEDGSALLVDVGGRYVESSQSPLVARLTSQGGRPLVELLSELAKAGRDDRIATVILRIQPLEVGWAKAQEIRGAITRLRSEGRQTVALLEVEKFGANIEYYVASAADRVVMVPAARNPLLGLAGEFFFLGGLFEKLGVELEYERVGRYKSAVESFAGTKMSEANREMTEALLDSIEGQLLRGIGEGRGLEVEMVREAVDAAPASPAEMQALGLVDDVEYLEDVIERLGDPPVVEARAYAKVDPASVGFAPVASIALLYGSGPVVTGEGSVYPDGNPVLAARTIAKAIEDAVEDAEVEAILFRIDSPGGSALASDLVWRAVARARAAGKPVVASFSDVAASGGYYVAAGADRIVAQPASLTGSIGVFVLRPVLRGLFDKLGIGVETMTRGAHADLLLASQPLSPGTRARLRADVQGVYQLFVERVAEGRSLSPEAVDAAGRGRVFTGAQAEEQGLVDVLGGLRTAVAEVKAALGLDPDADVVLVPYPPPKPLAAQIRELLGLSVHRSVAALTGMAELEPALVALRQLPAGAPLLVPPLLPRIR